MRKHDSPVSEVRIPSLNLSRAERTRCAADSMEWLAKNSFDYFKELSALYDLCAEEATHKFSAPGSGFPKNFEYRWTEDGGKQISSPEYVNRVFNWVEKTLNDPQVVPTDDESSFPSNFVSIVSKIFTRLFRIYAIMYHQYVTTLERHDAVEYLDQSFKNFMFFVFENDLVRKKEFKPIQRLVDQQLEEFNKEAYFPGVSMWSVDFPWNNNDESEEAKEPSSANSSIKQLDTSDSPPQVSEVSLTMNVDQPEYFLELPILPLSEPAQESPFHSRGNGSYLETLSTVLNTAGLQSLLQQVKQTEAQNPFVGECLASINELIDSEIEFGDMLCKIIDEYMIPAQTVALVSEDQLEKMFVDLPSMLRFSEMLCSDMHLAVQRLNLPFSQLDNGPTDPRRRASTSDNIFQTGTRQSPGKTRRNLNSTPPLHGGMSERHTPSCGEIVRTLLRSTLVPKLAFLPQIFSPFVASFADAIDTIKSTMGSNHLFSRLVQSKNAKLNVHLLDLLKHIRNRPNYYFRQVSKLCRSFEEYYSYSTWLENSLGAKQNWLSTTKNFLQASTSSISKRNLKDLDRFHIDTLDNIQFHVSAVNARAQFEKHCKKVERSVGKARVSSVPAQVRFDGLFRDRWKSCILHLLEDGGLIICSSKREKSRRLGTTFSLSGTFRNVTPFKSRPYRRRKGSDLPLLNLDHDQSEPESPNPAAVSGSFGLSAASLLTIQDRMQVDANFPSIAFTPRQHKSARIGTLNDDDGVVFTVSLTGIEGEHAGTRVVHLRLADFSAVLRLFRMGNTQLPQQLVHFPQLVSCHTAPSVERWYWAQSANRRSSKVHSPTLAEDMDGVDFFICHDPTRSELDVMDMYFDLSGRSHKVWIEQISHVPSHTTTAIESCRAVLFVLTPGALLQPSVRFQLMYAFHMGQSISLLTMQGDPVNLDLERRHCPPSLLSLFDKQVRIVPENLENRRNFWNTFSAICGSSPYVGMSMPTAFRGKQLLNDRAINQSRESSSPKKTSKSRSLVKTLSHRLAVGGF